MDLRPLGNTGIAVSPLGLGTVKIGRNEQVKYPEPFTLPDDETVSRLLNTARESGINVLDTAPAYGDSEERLGRLLTHRQHWVIITKTGEEFINGRSHFDFSAEATRRSVERSLRRLRVDCLDCVLVHSDGNDTDIIEFSGALPALAKLKEKGLIRSFGISTKTVAGARLALPLVDVLMVTYNPADRSHDYLIDQAHKTGVGILIKKAFASGHLDTLRKAVGDKDTDPVEATLRFIYAKAGVSSVIAGTVNPEHLRHNVAAARRALQGA